MSAGNCRVCLGFTHPLDMHGTGCPNAPVSAGDRDTLTELETGIANILDDMRTEWIEGLLPKLTEFVAARVRAACEKAWDEGYGVGANKMFPHNPYRLGDTEQSNHKVDGR